MSRLRTPAPIGPAQLRGRRGLSVTIRYRPPSLLLSQGHTRLLPPRRTHEGRQQQQEQQHGSKVAQVSKLKMGAPSVTVRHVAYDPSSRSIVLATPCAVYRLPLGHGALVPTLLAGRDDYHGKGDGNGSDARFQEVGRVHVASDGGVLVADLQSRWRRRGVSKASALRFVTKGGTVSTLASLDCDILDLDILPFGYVPALHEEGVTLLQPPPLCSARSGHRECHGASGFAGSLLKGGLPCRGSRQPRPVLLSAALHPGL